jgi:hypothetical protein
VGEMPLKLRREQLALHCMLKLKSNPRYPAFWCVVYPDFKTHFELQPHVVLGLHMKGPLLDNIVDMGCVASYRIWFRRHGLCNLPALILVCVRLGKKAYMHKDVFYSHLNEMLLGFAGFSVFTWTVPRTVLRRQ